MKKLLILLSFVCIFTINAQTVVKKNSEGNYILKPDSFTGHYFIKEKNTKYPVYVTSKGKLYYWSESKKTGKLYRRYITI